MKIRWIHTADVHLGNNQYGLLQRSQDFARAFKYVVDYTIQTRADFLLIAGDLFHKRQVDPRTVSQAYKLLVDLRDANIPVLCVEGNHERAFYDAGWTWLDFLSSQSLLNLLAPTYAEGAARLDPWDEENRVGGYIDIGPTRVHGIKYHGASASRVLDSVAEQLSKESRRPFSVLMLHEGMEGQIPRATGGLTSTQLEVLRPHCEYLAMGHIHKRYDFGGWAFNPGALETCSSEECDWERGYYEVTADTETRQLLEVKHLPAPRRAFHRYFIPIEGCANPHAVEELVLSRVGRDLDRSNGQAPVLEVTLKGTLQFSEEALDLDRIQARIREHWTPLVIRIKNNAMPQGLGTNVALGEDGQIDRRALELQVFTDIASTDSRYSASAASWARTVQQVKDAAIERLPANEVVEVLRRGAEVDSRGDAR